MSGFRAHSASYIQKENKKMKKLSHKETKLVKMWDRIGYQVSEITRRVMAWRNTKEIPKTEKLVRKVIEKRGEKI
jgi:hypothetical protein